MTETALIIGGSRLRAEEELAVNELLRRSAGECHGMPLYRITWAADDNRGLRRKHRSGCSRMSELDWTCGCPAAEPWLLPVCFHENVQSYHLLSWEPPSEALAVSDYQIRAEGFRREDYSKGTYSCVMHFIDPRTNEPLTNILPVVVEQIIPGLRMMKEMTLMAQHGMTAALEAKRQERNRALKDAENRKREAQRKHDLEMVQEIMHRPFGGEPYAMPGPKGRRGCEILTSDIVRERNP